MRSITTGDLCELTGYSRDQMRALLAELPRFANRHSEARVARVYSNHDVMLVVLLCRLETVYALKRSKVARLCEPIAAALTSPRQVSDRACLLLNLQEDSCRYADPPTLLNDGLVVGLAAVFSIIDAYIAPMPMVQREVGLSATRNARSRDLPSRASERIDSQADKTGAKGSSPAKARHG